MFFARSASFFEISMPFSASTVIEVKPTGWTLNSARESSSSGFVS